MVFLALMPLPVPSLVQFALLTSVSAKIDKADELSHCEQDSDVLSMMQFDKYWQKSVDDKANFGIRATADSSHVQHLPNTAANVGASLPKKECGPSLVQRILKYTSNKYQSAMLRAQSFLIVALILVAIVLLLGSPLAWLYVQQQSPAPRPSKMQGDGGAGAQTPFWGHNTGPLEASYISPSTTSHDRKPLRHTAPRLGETLAESRKLIVSPPRMPSLESNLSPPQPVVPSLVPKTAEAHFGSQHEQPKAHGSPRQSAPTQPGSSAPLHPAFVNLSAETRIGVHYLSLGDADEDTAVDVIYPTGRPYLRMTISKDDTHGYQLNINTAEAMQKACSIVSPDTSDARTPYRILNAQGVEHGLFRCVGPHLYEVIIRGVSAYMIQGMVENLQYQIVSDSKTVALARLNKTDFPGGEHLEFRILPGCDAVLVVAIVCGITIFNESY